VALAVGKDLERRLSPDQDVRISSTVTNYLSQIEHLEPRSVCCVASPDMLEIRPGICSVGVARSCLMGHRCSRSFISHDKTTAVAKIIVTVPQVHGCSP